MRFRPFSHLLVFIAATVAVASLLMFVVTLHTQQRQPIVNAFGVVQARHISAQTVSGATFLSPQVVVGTPKVDPATPHPQRYSYRNEFPADRTKWQTLYLMDTQTGQETRLGDDSYAAVFGVMDEEYLMWYSHGLHAYKLATREDIVISKMANPAIHPKLSGKWVIFGHPNTLGDLVATLYAANLQTHEIITLTHELNAVDASVNGDFGISSRLATWYTFSDPSQIIIYDLTTRTVVTTLTDYKTAFNMRNVVIYGLSPGETVVTWSSNFGYDLVTGTYFRIPTLYPPDWDGQPSTSVTPITEAGRVLSWTFRMQDGTHRLIKAPLLDATPSAAPCVENQNLVKNGDLEDIAAHNLWQQSGNPSDLIVNDLPPNAPQAGQWAIRLGRYSNAQQTIQQTLNIPSNVKHIQLAFDVRASSWDIWGGDQLQVDLIDPVSNQSILATPVQWTNRQLANGGWIPLQVDLQDWPGIDTPLELVFRAQTDWAFPTNFTLDNIRFLTACH